MIPYDNTTFDSCTDDTENDNLFIKARCNSSAFINNNTYVGLNVPYTNLQQELNLTPDKLVYGNTILGVEGTAVNTSDATAVANNIEEGITAYGTKGKLTGTIQTGNANIIINNITEPNYYFLNDFNAFFNGYQGVSSKGYIITKSQINSLIPEGRKFTIIAQFNKTNEQQYGYKTCYICVYPENATRCYLSGDSTNGYGIRCYEDNSRINFDLYTTNTYDTSTTLDKWLSTLTADSFTQSSVSNVSIRKE